ncbi:MAG TPA: helical backbone metal receptor [Thermoanaerobaculia bacterium]|nr:helical backbone metal receptor [Thermoanaerobaculia bacterium]
MRETRAREPEIGGKRHRVFSRAACLAALLILACGSPSSSREVTDGVGRTVQLPAKIERIVTLAPDVTEMVDAAGGGERIVGTDSFSDMPPRVKALPKVGDLQPSVEAIAALAPDLVIASNNGNPPSLARALAGARIPLYVLRSDRLDAIPQALRSLGAILGTGEVAEASAREFERGMQRGSRRRSTNPKVLVMLWPQPLYVAGEKTYIDDLLRLAGAGNAVKAEGWPAYSLEALAASPPDLILFPGRAIPASEIEKLKSTVAWRDLEAIRNGGIYPMPDDEFLRPGPRLVRGLEELNRILDAWESR